MLSEKGLLPETLLADTQQMLAEVPYDIDARTDYVGKYIRLRLYCINPNNTKSGISITLNPTLLWEHNKRAIELCIDALVREIKDQE